MAGDSWTRFNADYIPSTSLFWALIADIVLIAAVLYAAFTFRTVKALAVKILCWVAIVVVVSFALYQAHRLIDDPLRSSHYFRWRAYRAGLWSLPVLFLLVLVFSRRTALQIVKHLFLLILPLFPIVAVWTYQQYEQAASTWTGNGTAAGFLPATANRNRLVWIIFDELDSKLLFASRPPRVKIPELDRLRNQSLDASNVESPAMNTAVAVPSLLTAQHIDCLKLTKTEMNYRLFGSPKFVNFKDQPNIFAQARAAGFNTAVSGWLLPYCRLMGRDLSACDWALCGFKLSYVARGLRDRSFPEKVFYLLFWQAHILPYVKGRFTNPPETKQIYRQVDIETLKKVERAAEVMVRNPDLNLVFLHFPIPHPPGIWNNRTQGFTDEGSDYVDNLALTDLVLGKLRHVMEQAGQWDNTTILVSSDHPYRWSSWLTPESSFETEEMDELTGKRWQPFIPFLLKMPGQQTRLAYQTRFSTLLTSRLVLQILEGGLKQPSDVAAWLDANAAGSLAGSHPDNGKTLCGD